MSERPSYVPRIWIRGPINRLVSNGPGRMLVWWGFVLVLELGAIAWVVFDPHRRTLHIVVAALIGISVLQAFVYAPRAWRAWRRQSS